jgi:hypothetical protein
MFIQTLSLFIWLFGRVTSVAVLLNLFCYTGTIAVINVWSRRETLARTAAAFAMTAVSLSPALILWSLQPLKDTFFTFLVVAFVASCAAWQRAWLARARPGTLAVAGALQVALLFALAAIRWYFAFALLIAATCFLLLAIFRAHGRKLQAAAAAAIVVILFSLALPAGAGPYLPDLIRSLLRPTTAVASLLRLPKSLTGTVDYARSGFTLGGGSTTIEEQPEQPNVAATPVVPRVTAKTRPTRVAIAAAPSAAPPPALRHDNADGRVAVRSGGGKGTRKAAPPASAAELPASLPSSHDVRPAQVAARRSAPAVAAAAGRPEATPVPGTIPVRNPNAAADDSAFGSGSWRAVAAAAPPSSGPAPATTSAPNAKQRTLRLLTGAAAVVLPRSIGNALGLFHIGGGRGMLWFTELDTIVLDLVLIVALAVIALRFAESIRNPLVWLVVVLTVLVGAPLVYTVTNFGTLFRLREMIYFGLLLTPLAIASRSRSEAKTATKSEDVQIVMRPPAAAER